ncbi:MAG: MOSC domain-containing protein [Marinobacter sp.]|uniref:MOSC domain-containing protein n=1 Tax=Marinobacter sp. TaxID=50741 RepID=UPI00299E6F89|nr:MOSC domain-containing protein [Marinobacter sp.]MDX1756019.1 MOSC domain-containing protein [Marinobacter sp.]
MPAHSRLLSINVGARDTLTVGQRDQESGILKRPVAGRVRVGRGGLAEDIIVNRKHHGGPDQALYLYSGEDYAWWSAELDGEPAPGTFGENLTLSSFVATEPRLGDRYQLGEVLLEVTAPRIPCATFAARMNDPQFPARFIEARRPGLYVRVLQTGDIQAGETVAYQPTTEEHPTVNELFDLFYRQERDPDLVRRCLAAPVSERVRKKLELWQRSAR